MFKIIGAAALKDMIGLVKKEDKFFSLNQDERKKLIEAKLAHYPASLTSYLDKAKESEFISDAGLVAQVANGLTLAKKSALLAALSGYISQEIGHVLDHLDTDFFFMEMEKREKALEKLLPGHSVLAQATRELFAQSTYQEVTSMANEALSLISDTPVIVVQTPHELEAEKRTTVRSLFNKKHPGSFAEFQTNPQIIGGMRIFVNGDVVDHSWLAKVQAITSL